MKVAAVVVTYNRKEELIKNIKEILSQSYLVDKYYIIDNHSNDGTKELLDSDGILKNKIIEYVYLDKNIGGAGGFYTGVKMAYEAGYDYVCLMDDDGRPGDKMMMENLIDAARKEKKNNPKILLNSIVCGFGSNKLSFGLLKNLSTKDDILKIVDSNNLLIGSINPFNGTLVSKELIEAIGFPNKDFFIKGDESDFTRRAIAAGAFVATVTNSNYCHPILNQVTINIFGKKIKGSTESPWKEYYRARNYTYMFKRDGENKLCVKQNLKQIIFALRFNDKKIKTIKMIIKGWKDGRKGNLGCTVKP